MTEGIQPQAQRMKKPSSQFVAYDENAMTTDYLDNAADTKESKRSTRSIQWHEVRTR